MLSFIKKYFVGIIVVAVTLILVLSVFLTMESGKTDNVTIAQAITNFDSEKVDIKIGEKIYSYFMGDIENIVVDKEQVVARYMEESAFFNKTIWFYSVPNSANCDLILDSKYNTLFCVSEDLEKAEQFYNDYNNYNFYKSSLEQTDDDISISDMESLKVNDSCIFERFYHYTFTDKQLVKSLLVEIPDDSIKKQWIVSAVSNDGLIRRDFIFVETDDGIFLEIQVNAGMDSVSGINIYE